MPMTVPVCPEWQAEPGFTTTDCHCVKVVKYAVADCTACKGTGVIGLVPGGVWEEARKKADMPELKGDPRFDPRPDHDWVERILRSSAAQRAEEKLALRLFAAFFVASITVAVVTCLLIR